MSFSSNPGHHRTTKLQNQKDHVTETENVTTRRSIIQTFGAFALGVELIPMEAEAKTDCMSDCLKNCKLIAPKVIMAKNEY